MTRRRLPSTISELRNACCGADLVPTITRVGRKLRVFKLYTEAEAARCGDPLFVTYELRVAIAFANGVESGRALQNKQEGAR